MNERLTEIAHIWKQNQWLYSIGGFLIGLLAYPSMNLLVTDLLSLLNNLVPEAIGIVVTVFVIERFNRNREEKRRIDELKAKLVRESGSLVNDVAVHAIQELRSHGWLSDKNGLLAGASLIQTNLQYAPLKRANLEGVNIKNANFQNADLHGAILKNAHVGLGSSGAYFQEANLSSAQFQEANLINSNLEHANLESTYFQGACLARTNLRGANLCLANLDNTVLSYANLEEVNLSGSNLKGAIIDYAKFNEKTVLPDANLTQEKDSNDNAIYNKYWTPDIDMRRYTDPYHKDKDGELDFWQPHWAQAGFDNWGDWNLAQLENQIND